MNELQTLLADSAADLFAAEVTPEVLAAADRCEWAERLWRVLEEAEYPRLFAEDGVSWADAYPLVEAAGNALAPVPLPETLLASWLLARVGIEQPAGIVTIVARPWTGSAAGVPWAARAAHAVVVRDGAAPEAALIATAGLDVTPGHNAAAEPRDDVRGDPQLLARAPLGDLPSDVLYRFGALVRATQIAGALRRVLALTTRYARERTQFGRPIGDFQAISQQLAVLAEETTAATLAAAFAWGEAADDPATPAIAVAKVRAGQAAGTAARIAHAVFGAIGITAEHELHFATRRLWCWRAEFGPEHAWARDLGANIIRAGATSLWPNVTA